MMTDIGLDKFIELNYQGMKLYPYQKHIIKYLKHIEHLNQKVSKMAIDSKSSYYDAGGIEVISIIKAKLPQEQYKGYLLGNIIKYSCRANFKNETMERDIEKVSVYAKQLNELLNNIPQVGKLVPINIKSDNIVTEISSIITDIYTILGSIDSPEISKLESIYAILQEFFAETTNANP